jgi:S1-C subfamily serine protease
MDPGTRATVLRVAEGSIADRAGIRPGDALTTLEGQPILSTADIQWVLHNAPRSGSLQALAERHGDVRPLTLELPEGWRRGNLSWRATSWELRRIALGGLKIEDLSDDERVEARLGRDVMALKVEHVGEFGEHARAKEAGFRRGDVIVSYDGMAGRLSESDLFAHALQEKRPGDRVAVEVLRDGERKSFELTLQ